MSSQICPHCDTEITQNDLDNYPIKVKKRMLREEYRKSKIGRKNENKVITAVFGLLFMGFMPILVMIANSEVLIVPYSKWLFVVEMIFGAMAIIWFIYGSIIKLPNLEDRYIESRLRENK